MFVELKLRNSLLVFVESKFKNLLLRTLLGCVFVELKFRKLLLRTLLVCLC